MTANPEPAVSRADVLREAADICDEAGAVYTSKALNDHAYVAFTLMERFQRKADEAEYVATPCSVGGCEPGGEPCATHERLMAHAEGDHELCQPDCGERPAVVSSPPAAWIDGHPQLEAIASAVYERCETGDGGIVHDDPRNIAVAVLAVLPDDGRATALETTLTNVRAMHRKRTERHGSGCVQCGIVWPCPTYKALDEQELRRLADEAQQPTCVLCGHRTCTLGQPCGVIATERGDLPEPCGCTGVGARQPDTETQDGIVRCAAAVLKRHHGPHRWAPQPGMNPVRCPGSCNCPHPDGEHSVYGCADGCACEYLPPPRRAGGAGGVADETERSVKVTITHVPDPPELQREIARLRREWPGRAR